MVAFLPQADLLSATAILLGVTSCFETGTVKIQAASRFLADVTHAL